MQNGKKSRSVEEPSLLMMKLYISYLYNSALTPSGQDDSKVMI